MVGEAPLEQLAHVGLDAEVGRHPCSDVLSDVTLTELQDNLAVLRALDLVGAGNDGFAVFNKPLVTLKPVGAECRAQALNSSLLTSVSLLRPNFVTRRFQALLVSPLFASPGIF